MIKSIKLSLLIKGHLIMNNYYTTQQGYLSCYYYCELILLQ